MNTETTAPRKHTIAGRQNNEIELVNRLYEVMPVGKEEMMGVSVLRERIDLSDISGAVGLISRIEQAGILSRRIDWVGGKGKQSYWTLLVPKAEALKLITKIHSSENTLSNQERYSLKQRILGALQERNFDTVVDIVRYISNPGENIDLHNVTHLLHSLKNQGKVSFKKDNSGRGASVNVNGKRRKSNNAIPHDIKLTKIESKRQPEARVTEKPIQLFPEQENPFDSMSEEEFVAGAESFMKAVSQPDEERFNLLYQIVTREESLKSAASLAEKGGAIDLSLALLEEAEKPMSALEQQIMDLWFAYKECSK